MRKLISKIIDENGKFVRHGRYTYYLNVNTGEVMRCLTDEIGKRWISYDGTITDGWETIEQLH